MYFKFCFIFVLFLIENFVAKTQFEDDQPFVSMRDQLSENDNETMEVKCMLFPSLGFEKFDQPGKYKLIINGWCYEPLSSTNFKKYLSKAFEGALLALDPKETFSKQEKRERLAPFFVHNLMNYNIRIEFETVSSVVKTDDDGLFKTIISIDSLDALTVDNNHKLEYTATDESNQIMSKGSVYLMNNQAGCSIISNIDDTIKISEILDKKKFTVNTFKKEYTAVPGMSDIYRLWQSSHQCLFHYISSMPLQFYYVTQKFIDDKNFPQGSFHMRHLKLSTNIISEVLQNLNNNLGKGGTQIYKTEKIKEIIERSSPLKKFILVGDSAEDDPEIYGTLARDHPTKIHMIFIRLVPGGMNNDKRFEKAFEDIAKEKWHLFAKANELPESLFPDEKSITEEANASNTDADSDKDANNLPQVSSSNYANILSLPLLLNIISILFSI